MRILLTGAGGQLGSALRACLTTHDLVALEHAQLDIASLGAVRDVVRTQAPQVVINAAAYNDVDGAETRSDDAFAGNALGPRNLALATAERGAVLVHVSSDYVFDGTSRRPYHEFDRPNPRSVYAASKLAGEEAVRALNPRHYVVRTAWLYHTIGRNFPKTMRGLAERSEVRVVSDQFGSPTYAPHLAVALTHLLATDAFGTYHLAGSGGTSWYELTVALYRELGITTPVRPVATAEFPRPAERPRYSVLTTLQEPHILLPPWHEGLAEFARALRSEPGR
jgi:dTDP-4-dehydrorhamnose reductase